MARHKLTSLLADVLLDPILVRGRVGGAVQIAPALRQRAGETPPGWPWPSWRCFASSLAQRGRNLHRPTNPPTYQYRVKEDISEE